jgi:hypothetical protein
MVHDGVDVRLGVHVADGVGEAGVVGLGVGDEDGGVAVGGGSDASKTISATRSAAVTWPSPFTSASGQVPAVSLKIASTTADMSAASRTPSQLASPFGNCATAVDTHSKQNDAAAKCATAGAKRLRLAHVIRT